MSKPVLVMMGNVRINSAAADALAAALDDWINDRPASVTNLNNLAATLRTDTVLSSLAEMIESTAKISDDTHRADILKKVAIMSQKAQLKI